MKVASCCYFDNWICKELAYAHLWNVEYIHHFNSLGLVLWHIQNYLHFTDEKIEAQLDWFYLSLNGLPWWLNSKESTCNSGDVGSIPKSGRHPWGRKWKPTPVFLPRKSHGKRSLAGYSPWGHKNVGHDLGLNSDNKQGLQLVWKAQGPSKDTQVGRKEPTCVLHVGIIIPNGNS